MQEGGALCLGGSCWGLERGWCLLASLPMGRSPAPAQPLLMSPVVQLQQGHIGSQVPIPWKSEGISSVVTYEQHHTTPQHRDTDMLLGHTGQEGTLTCQASTAACSRLGGRAGSGVSPGTGSQHVCYGMGTCSLTQLAHPPEARGGSRQSSTDMQMESRKRGNEREC